MTDQNISTTYVQKAEVTRDRCDIMKSERKEEKLSSKVQEVSKSRSGGMRARVVTFGHDHPNYQQKLKRKKRREGGREGERERSGQKGDV